MKYLLDTNIISETAKRQPNKGVITWLSTIPNTALCLSVISIGEIRKGIEMLQDQQKRLQLINWLDFEMQPWFGKNIIPISIEIAERWGYICATNSLPAIDGLIAATALTHNLILINRNTKDFNVSGLEVINPFLYT